MMFRYFSLILTICLTGCAFYEKNFISEVVLDGTNYRGKVYDEGVFYINDAPSIEMRMGCFRRTQLGETMFLLIPFPIVSESEPHESIAANDFSLTLTHSQKDKIDLSALKIDVELLETTYPMHLTGKEEQESGWSTKYEFAAGLRCDAISDGKLIIKLGPDKIREYGVQFEEDFKREFAWHTGFVT